MHQMSSQLYSFFHSRKKKWRSPVYIKFTDKNTSVRDVGREKHRAILYRSDWGRSRSQGNHDSYPSSGINSRTIWSSTTQSPHWRELCILCYLITKIKAPFNLSINNIIVVNDKYWIRGLFKHYSIYIKEKNNTSSPFSIDIFWNKF